MTNDELAKIRKIKITTVLGIADTGRRISIRCPVHNEKSPSMVIYPDGSYYCYGCSANGQNAIDFLVGMGASFQEAIEELKRHR